MTAVVRAEDLIAAERRRQIDAEGYTPEHDSARNGPGALYAAARAYGEADPMRWPFPEGTWKPKNRLRDLIRAGALALAAVDLAREQRKFAVAALGKSLYERVVAEVDGILGEAARILGVPDE